MSNSKSSSASDASKAVKRNLPSWMSKKDNGSGSSEKKPTGSGENEESCGSKNTKASPASGTVTNRDFSKLLEGVVFVLSGFVNPERSILRSQAMEMGAQYQADWNSECTLLVCAFPNTPKFRQVEADCGTIVFKEWISECYAQKKLLDIEIYLMHAGKPWRRSNLPHETSPDKNASPPRKSQKLVDRVPHPKPNDQAISKIEQCRASNPARKHFSPSKMKKWAIDDLHKTISWLESQEEKPAPGEIGTIAADGILTCLQDAIDSLEQNQGVRKITEQWNFVPQIVEELAKLESAESNTDSKWMEELCRRAIDCKQIYEVELNSFADNSSLSKKEPKTSKEQKCKSEKTKDIRHDIDGYESDNTIEMTEEEIDHAYNTVTSKFCKS